jgi:hypothetical protein
MIEKHRRIGTAIWFSLMIGIFVAAMLKVFDAPVYFWLLSFTTARNFSLGKGVGVGRQADSCSSVYERP